MSHVLRFLRRYPEALDALDQALALDPPSIAVRHARANVSVLMGDVAEARRMVAEAPPEVDQAVIGAHFATYGDLYWLLDTRLQDVVLALPPSAFDDDRGTWALVRAQMYHTRGQRALARAFADTAQMVLASQQLAQGQGPALRGLALAYMGHFEDAIAQAKRGVKEAGEDNESLGYNRLQLARVYVLAGRAEQALDELEPLARSSVVVSPGWVRVDPHLAPLRGNPRFERLVAGS